MYYIIIILVLPARAQHAQRPVAADFRELRRPQGDLAARGGEGVREGFFFNYCEQRERSYFMTCTQRPAYALSNRRGLVIKFIFV